MTTKCHRRLRVVVASLEVRSGEGGVTPMSGADDAMVRSDAVKSLKPSKFPEIVFVGSSVSPAERRLPGCSDLTIAGTSVPHSVDVEVADTATCWDMSVHTTVSEKAVALKSCPPAMGALMVADEVALDS